MIQTRAADTPRRHPTSTDDFQNGRLSGRLSPFNTGTCLIIHCPYHDYQSFIVCTRVAKAVGYQSVRSLRLKWTLLQRLRLQSREADRPYGAMSRQGNNAFSNETCPVDILSPFRFNAVRDRPIGGGLRRSRDILSLDASGPQNSGMEGGGGITFGAKSAPTIWTDVISWLGRTHK